MPSMTVWPVSSFGAHAERRILLSQPAERRAHLVLVGPGLRLDRDRDDRLREDDRLKHDRVGWDHRACRR